MGAIYIGLIYMLGKEAGTANTSYYVPDIYPQMKAFLYAVTKSGMAER